MTIVDLTTIDLPEGHFADDPATRFRADFALFGGTGAEDLAVVTIELEPGRRLGRHADCAEEVLLVLEGEVEVSVGEERARAARGGLVVVPAMVPHDLRNVVAGPARIVGFFPSPAVVATFEAPIEPLGERAIRIGPAAPVAAASARPA